MKKLVKVLSQRIIITIIVLLILAVVAIRAVSGNGIIAYAQNAATDYNQAQKVESDMLQSYLNQLDDSQNKINNAANPVKLIKFKIDFSDYSSRYEGVIKEYIAVEGMTWEKWFEDDKYNTDELKMEKSGNNNNAMYVNPEKNDSSGVYLQEVSCEDYFVNGQNVPEVSVEDVIKNGKTYYLWGC